MQMTMRWFGPDEDKVTLEQIRQVPGVEGVVGALYDVPVGEVWPREKIKALVEQAHANGLTMEVIESVNIQTRLKSGCRSAIAISPTISKLSVTSPPLALRSSATTLCRFSTG